MKCSFGPCTCDVLPGEEHCAPTCRMGLGDAGEACKCGHADCSETVGKG